MTRVLVLLSILLAGPALAQLADDPNDVNRRMQEQSQRLEAERTQREADQFRERNRDIDAGALRRNQERQRLDELERRRQRERPPVSGPKPGD
jgi:hypothetical protein